MLPFWHLGNTLHGHGGSRKDTLGPESDVNRFGVDLGSPSGGKSVQEFGAKLVPCSWLLPGFLFNDVLV